MAQVLEPARGGLRSVSVLLGAKSPLSILSLYPLPSSGNPLHPVGSAGWTTTAHRQEEERTEWLSLLSWAGSCHPCCSLHGAIADRKGLAFFLRSMHSLAFHFFPTPEGDHAHFLPEFSIAPFLRPPLLPHVEGPPAPPSSPTDKMSLQPTVTPFPCSLTFILTTLFRVASGLLAARPNSPSSVECTALASWT